MELKIGDKVRLKRWSKDIWVKVLCIGKKEFFGLDNLGYETLWCIDNNWLPYQEPNDDLVKDAQPKTDYSTHFEIAELKKSINNINKRLGDIEASRGKLSKTDKKDIDEQYINLKRRVIMLEQLQQKKTHPYVHDNQPEVKACYNCEYSKVYNDQFPCNMCCRRVTLSDYWEDKQKKRDIWCIKKEYI